MKTTLPITASCGCWYNTLTSLGLTSVTPLQDDQNRLRGRLFADKIKIRADTEGIDQHCDRVQRITGREAIIKP